MVLNGSDCTGGSVLLLIVLVNDEMSRSLSFMATLRCGCYGTYLYLQLGRRNGEGKQSRVDTFQLGCSVSFGHLIL